MAQKKRRGLDAIREQSARRVKTTAPTHPEPAEPTAVAPAEEPAPVPTSSTTTSKPSGDEKNKARTVRTTLLIYQDTADRLDDLIWDEWELTGEKPRKIALIESAITHHMPSEEDAKVHGKPRDSEAVKLYTEVSMGTRRLMRQARKARNTEGESIPVAWFYSQAIDEGIKARRQGLGL